MRPLVSGYRSLPRAENVFQSADPNPGDLAAPVVSDHPGADLEIGLVSTGRPGENRRDLQVRQANRGTPGVCVAAVSTCSVSNWQTLKTAYAKALRGRRSVSATGLSRFDYLA